MKNELKEQVVLVGDSMSMAQTLIRFEHMGIDVVDVLPLVRAIIIKPTPTQIRKLMSKELWKNKPQVKKSLDVLFD